MPGVTPGLGLDAVKPSLGPGRPQVQRVGLPVQERDRLADVGLECVDEVVGLRLGGTLVASVARVVVAAEQLAGRQRLVGVPAEALVGVPCAAGRLHDDEVAGTHVAETTRSSCQDEMSMPLSPTVGTTLRDDDVLIAPAESGHDGEKGPPSRAPRPGPSRSGPARTSP
jgi:hypothetical protein